MDGRPDPVNTSAIEGAIASLAAVDLQRVQQLIERKDWPQAINELDAIAAQAKKVQNAARRMASRAAKQHWSPLLEMADAPSRWSVVRGCFGGRPGRALQLALRSAPTRAAPLRRAAGVGELATAGDVLEVL